MLLAFMVFAVFTAGFLLLNKPSKRAWVLIVILACMFCVFLAFISISAVWVPHPLSDHVFRYQNTQGEYEGMFPLSKLSYPFYLNVYHSPYSEVTFADHIAQGKASFSVFLDGTRILGINGTFSYLYVLGPMPMSYTIDFIFSDSLSFSCFLFVLFMLVNMIGAFLGIILGRILAKRIRGSSKQLASGQPTN